MKYTIDKNGYETFSFNINKGKSQKNKKSGGSHNSNEKATVVSPSTSRPVKKMKTKSLLTTFMSLVIDDNGTSDRLIMKWIHRPQYYPDTDKLLKINFLDGTTDYGELYSSAFELFWNNYWKDISEDDIHFNKKLKNTIKIMKSKLPSMHCFKMDNEYMIFDYLFYFNISKKIRSEKLYKHLRYYNLYEQMKYDSTIVLGNLNTPLDSTKLVDFISKHVKTFVTDFTNIVFTAIYDMADLKKIVSESTSDVLSMYLKTFHEILQIKEHLIQTLIIKKCILDEIRYIFKKRKGDSEHIELEQHEFNEFETFITTNCIKLFLITCAENLQEISQNNTTNGNNSKKLKLSDPREIEEPVRPYLIPEPVSPDLPNIENIRANFASSDNHTFSDMENYEINEIYESKMKQYNRIKQDKESFPKKRLEHEMKMKDYTVLKKKYDVIMKNNQLKSLSPLKIGSTTKTPPRKGKKREEILEEFIGDNVTENQRCKLGEDGELISPFTTSFDPLVSYPLYKLQSMVKIHVRDEQNNIVRTDCGNAIDMYNYIIDFYNEGKIPKHPLMSQNFTEENIDAIMANVPFAVNDINVKRPIIDNTRGNELFLHIHFSTYDNEDQTIPTNYNLDYYKLYIMRNFGGKKDKYGFITGGGYNVVVQYLCAFPSFIDINEGDVSTERTTIGMIEQFYRLFTYKRLLRNYNPPYCVVSNNTINNVQFSAIAINPKILRMKSIFYWLKGRDEGSSGTDSSKTRKKWRTQEEIKKLFIEYYDDLANF